MVADISPLIQETSFLLSSPCFLPLVLSLFPCFLVFLLSSSSCFLALVLSLFPCFLALVLSLFPCFLALVLSLFPCFLVSLLSSSPCFLVSLLSSSPCFLALLALHCTGQQVAVCRGGRGGDVEEEESPPPPGKTHTHGQTLSLLQSGGADMTRWARANNVHKHKPAEATPWSQLRAAGGGGGGGGRGGHSGPSRGPQRDHLRGTQPGGSAVKKTNRKKKEYVDEDVNGFLEFLQKSGQAPPKGGAGGRVEEERELREEVETALKKDRRREDRRMKRQNDKKNNMLCFNCRKPGHGLADCPEADRDEEMGRGICYRCGSTEHEIQRCRAKVDPALGEFPFAKCFICGQTGHLSRSCPDNPKGLYAQGGCCRVCGSVEHFQKDCPDHQAATSSVTVAWLSNNMSADHEEVHVPVKKAKPKQTKVVTF